MCKKERTFTLPRRCPQCDNDITNQLISDAVVDGDKQNDYSIECRSCGVAIFQAKNAVVTEIEAYRGEGPKVSLVDNGDMADVLVMANDGGVDNHRWQDVNDVKKWVGR